MKLPPVGDPGILKVTWHLALMAAVLSVVVADRVLGHKMVTREAPTSGGRQGMVPLGGEPRVG